MDARREQHLKIATALEKLVTDAVDKFEFGLNVLKIPNSLRAPLWDALGRRSISRAAECDRRKD